MRLSRRRWMAAGLVGLAQAQTERPVRVAMLGVGNRGTSLMRTMLSQPGVDVPAVCDVNEERVSRAQELVAKTGRGKPEGYQRGPEDYRRLLDRTDLDAVIVATPWQWHTRMAVAAMKAGKYAGVEVPAALTVEECWELVDTSEKTGVPCMMLENVCYFRNVLMVLNLARQGVLGELLDAEAGYQHYLPDHQFTSTGDLTWRAVYAAERNGNQYPTHPIGPVAWWMNINRGDRFTYLNSMSSRSLGPHLHAERKFGKDHPAARRVFAQGDVNTTLIRTENGLTVTLYYNTQSPRPYDLILRLQGTQGIYSGTLDKIYLQGRSPKTKGGEPEWESTAPYFERYEHPLWTRLSKLAANSGHGGADYITLHEFLRAVRHKTQTPIDVYDSATWSVIVPLTQQSVAARGAPTDFPDFTRGRWRTAKPLAVE